MICYRDRCFCSNTDCKGLECRYNYKQAVKERAIAEEKHGFQFPIAVSDFDDCLHFKPKGVE